MTNGTSNLIAVLLFAIGGYVVGSAISQKQYNITRTFDCVAEEPSGEINQVTARCSTEIMLDIMTSDLSGPQLKELEDGRFNLAIQPNNSFKFVEEE